MARPLSGNFKQLADGSWSVSVPKARGSLARDFACFANRAAAEVWIDDVRLAFDAGEPAPPPRTRRLVPHEDTQTESEVRLTPLDELFERHWNEQYVLLEQAKAGRAEDVEASYRLHVRPALTAMGVDCIEQLERKHVIGFVRHLAGKHTVDGPGLEGLWIGERPPVPSGKDGRPGLLRSTARNVLQVLRAVIALALADGLVDADPSVGINVMDPSEHEERTHRQRRIPLRLCVALAEHMSPGYQVAMWIDRLVGFRVDEVFNLRVEAVVRKQGRTVLRVFDSKSPAGTRDTPVAERLAEMLWWFIEVVHGPASTRDPKAWLIPTSTGRDGAGYSTYRAHLREAGKQVDLASFDEELDPPRMDDLRTHGFRKSLASDLSGHGTIPEVTVQRYVGHAAGRSTLAKFYVLKGLLSEFGAIADAVDGMLSEERITDLRIPTTIQIKFRKENPLHGRADEINAALREAGWLVDLAAVNGETWLTVDGIAEQLGVSGRTVRRLLLNGDLPGQKVGIDGWCVKQSDVDAYINGDLDTHPLTLDEIAARNHLGYHEAYKMLKRLDPSLSDGSGKALVVTEEHDGMLAAECERLEALYARAVPVVEAARMLRKSVSAINRTWIKTGLLTVDPETDATGQRFVTRSSIAVHEGDGAASVTLTVAEAASVLGASVPSVLRLIDAGTLVRTRVGRKTLVTAASVRRCQQGRAAPRS